MRQRVLILDKSALQALPRNRPRGLDVDFAISLTPTLFSEVVADLSKEMGSRDPEHLVASLAGKIGPMASWNQDSRSLLLASLAGGDVPMTGRIIVDPRFWFRNPRTGGVIIDEKPISDAVHRWCRGEFSMDDRSYAKEWRDNAATLSLGPFEKHLAGRGLQAPRPGADQSLGAIVDAMLSDETQHEPWLLYLMDERGFSIDQKRAVRRRWAIQRPVSIEQFAPYAHFKLRALLHVLVLWLHGITKQEPSNLLDVQYLYYLPFCDVFCSNDKLHLEVAPSLARPDQSVVSLEQLLDGLSTV